MRGKVDLESAEIPRGAPESGTPRIGEEVDGHAALQLGRAGAAPLDASLRRRRRGGAAGVARAGVQAVRLSLVGWPEVAAGL